MLRQVPAKRYEAIKSGIVSADPDETALQTILKTGVCDNSVVAYAHEIFTERFKKEVLEAFILAKSTDDEIAKVLKIPQDVTQVYRKLFFDISVFRDELDIEAYVQTYPKKPDPWGHDIKVCALTLGMDYLRFRFGRGSSNIDITGALTDMIANAHFLARAARINPLNAESTKEARSWMQATIKAMEAYVKVKPATESTDDEFELALKTIDQTTNEQLSADIEKDKIIH